MSPTIAAAAALVLVIRPAPKGATTGMTTLTAAVSSAAKPGADLVHHFRLSMAAAVLAAAACGTARAQSSQGEAAPIEPAPAQSPVTVSLFGEGRLAFRANLKSSPGDVQVWNTGGGASIRFPVSEQWRLTFRVHGEYSNYDFGGATALVPGAADPFDDMYEAGTAILAEGAISGPWSLSTGAYIRSAGEPGAAFGDTLWGGGFVGVGYAFSESFRLTIGGGITTRLDDNPLFVPVVGIEWQITERLRLETQGFDLLLKWEPRSWLEVYAKGAWEYRQFRLDDDRAALPSGVIRDNRFPVGGGVAFKPFHGLRIAIEGGAIVYQEFDVLRSSGNKLTDVETEPAAYIMLRVDYRF